MISKDFSDVDEFCQYHGATRRIKRILIASNGNAAMKFALSIRDWSLKTFNNEYEIELVGVVTPDDENSGAEYISHCDYIARLPGGANNYNYANVDIIVEIANNYECDAVWPGWGHASENDEAPRMLTARSRAVWIGPNPDAMVAVGCKIASTIVAQSLGVSTIAWSGSEVLLEKTDNGVRDITDADIKKACISCVEDLYSLIDRKVITFPIMLKAAAGGGGKGIRIIRDRESAANAFHVVASEVPGSLIFAMKCLADCRHIEVQILADLHGNVIACGARDCSIQRRHQKIIEEGPPVCVDQKTLKELYRCATSICAAVGYENAGTVEFLYDPGTKEFFFMEVNARLQVEHVVTEILMQSNLPAAQVQIAMGIPLSKIDILKDYIEKYNKGLPIEGHCIAARIVAENAENNFQPTTGIVQELNFIGGANVWGYFSVGQGSRVHQYCDSQIGHIFSTGKNRDDARKNLLSALRRLIIRGEITTNVVALQTILRHPDYIANNTHTCWLENKKICQITDFSAGQAIPDNLFNAILYAAVYKAVLNFSEAESEFYKKISLGQVPPKLPESFSYEFVYRNIIKFIVTCYQTSQNLIRVCLNDSDLTVRYTPCTTSGLDNIAWYFMSGGSDMKHRKVGFQLDNATDEIKVRLGSETYILIKDVDPTKFRADYAAKIVRWLVKTGDVVHKTTPIAEIELMKMYIQLYPNVSGVITIRQNENVGFQPGDLLATFEPLDGFVVEKPVLYSGSWPINHDNTLRSRITGNR